MKALFIVGTGRSGTHFTCRALAGFQNIVDPHSGRENVPILRSIATSAIHHRDLERKVISYYKGMRDQIPGGRIFLDQHHPNLFFVKELREIFDDALFIFPDRPTVQIVASMMRHRGVQKWYQYAKDSTSSLLPRNRVPFPNRFLGLASKEELFELDIHKLCTWRVIAHKNHMNKLAQENDFCRLLVYEDLVARQKTAFEALFSDDELAELGDFSVVEESNAESISKYKEVLSSKQIEEIMEIEAMALKEHAPVA